MPELDLGELEQVVLLGILAEGAQAFSLQVRKEIERATGQRVSRGAFYTTLERLHRKGFVAWEASRPRNARRKGTQRRFTVTPAGLEALRFTRSALHARWARLDQALEKL
ncbi:MAG: PadR family transcriptional regulator [Longimicrobiales bacterium]